MEYTIETDRPMPVRGKYQPIIRQMNIGDSVLFTDASGYSVLHIAAKRLGFKITAKAEALGIRVWRTK